MRRGLGVVLALVLAIGVVAAVVLGRGMGASSSVPSTPGGRASGGTGGPLTTVVGVVGSEKEPFFRDPKVRAVFARNGLDVQVTPAGSLEIASLPDLATKDFAFPSSAPAADVIRRKTATKATFSPFYSPIAVASFAPVVTALERNKVVRPGPGGARLLDMKAYAALTAKGTRWNQLPGNTAYPADKDLLVTTTDIRTSNSAAMYLAVMSYVLNNGKVVTAGANAQATAAKAAPLFLGQGYVNGSSEGPFEDYLAAGMGKSPLVTIYEAQFLGRQLAKDGSVTQDMTLLYPSPTVLSKHTLVAFKDSGTAVGRLLTEDPELMALEARYGFRPQQQAVFAKVLTDAGVPVPPALVDVIEPPTYEALQQMISAISTQYG